MTVSSANMTFLGIMFMFFRDCCFSSLCKLSWISSSCFSVEKFISFSYRDCKFWFEAWWATAAPYTPPTALLFEMLLKKLVTWESSTLTNDRFLTLLVLSFGLVTRMKDSLTTSVRSLLLPWGLTYLLDADWTWSWAFAVGWGLLRSLAF